MENVQSRFSTHQNFVASNFFTDVSNAFLFSTRHGEAWSESCNFEEEICEHFLALRCEIDFGVELDAVDTSLLVVDSSDNVRRACGADFELFAYSFDGVAMGQKHVLRSLESAVRVEIN